jgi:hypothetical protein
VTFTLLVDRKGKHCGCNSKTLTEDLITNYCTKSTIELLNGWNDAHRNIMSVFRSVRSLSFPSCFSASYFENAQWISAFKLLRWNCSVKFLFLFMH